MTVRAFRIENFMAFGEAAEPDDGWIDLRPVCLLFGRNSSGKSAIIRALRLLKQSLIDTPQGSPFAYSAEDGVDVGSFLEMVHRPYPPDDPPIIRFSFRCDVSPIALGRLLTDFSVVPAEEAKVDLTMGFGWLPFRKQAGLVELAIETERSSAGVGKRRVAIFRAEMIKPASERRYEDEWWYQSDILTGEAPDKIWELVTPQLVRGFLPQMVAPQSVYDEMRAQPDWGFGQDLESLRTLLSQLQEIITAFIAKIEYVRPLRPEPKRMFVLDDSQQRRWREQGLYGYLRLLQGEEDLPPTKREELDTWLRKLNLGDSISAETHVDSSKHAVVTGLNLDEGENGVRKVNLADMGYGVSQVLPVLIQAILAEPGQLVIVEQPELHLHPRAQAELGDLFILMAQQGVRFFIETHSEHLLLRLRRCVAETHLKSLKNELSVPTDDGAVYRPDSRPMLSPAGVAVYFVDRTPNTPNSKVFSLEVDQYGDLPDPPEGFASFFSDDAKEIMAITRAALTSEGLEKGQQQ